MQPASLGAQASTPTHSIPTFVSESGRFSIQYPPGYSLHTDERPGVDGVTSPLPENTVAILSNTSPNFLLTIQHISLTDDSSPEALAGYVNCDLDLSAAQTVLIENQPALLFPDQPCGPYGSSFILLSRGIDGYVITIESHQPYHGPSEPVMQMLSKFQYLGTN